MATHPKIREQHIAVFGETGSGKTVLAASFFGPAQEKSASNGLGDLVADDASQGNRLYKNYLGMRDHATAPAPNKFTGTTYYFSVKLKGGDAKAKKRPFDILRLAWHDYPGNGSKSRRAARRRLTDALTCFGYCCGPTSHSCWSMDKNCWTIRARRSGTSSRF
jgi:ABC-type dipeptide/oligopeptide/nickel transport system ATPase component